MARFAGGVEGGYQDHLLCFGGQLPGYLSKRSIHYCPCQLMILEHPYHIERFLRNAAGFRRQARGQFVDGIRPQVRNPQIQAGQLALRFAPVLAALLFSGQPAVQAPSFLLGVGKVLLVLKHLTLTINHERLHANFNPKHPRGSALSKFRYLDGNAHKPIACSLTDPRPHNLALEAQGFGHIHPAEFWNLVIPCPSTVNWSVTR